MGDHDSVAEEDVNVGERCIRIELCCEAFDFGQFDNGRGWDDAVLSDVDFDEFLKRSFGFDGELWDTGERFDDDAQVEFRNVENLSCVFDGEVGRNGRHGK